MPQHKLGPAAPDVVCSERVPYGMERPRRWFKAELSAQDVEVAQDNTAPEFVAVARCEQQAFEMICFEIPPEDFPKTAGEWVFAFLLSLPRTLNSILSNSQRQCLVNSLAGVQ